MLPYFHMYSFQITKLFYCLMLWLQKASLDVYTSLCACVCVVYVWAHVCMHVWCVCTCIGLCERASVYVLFCCMWVSVCVCMWGGRGCVCCICVCVHVCVHVCVYVCGYVHTCVCMCMCMHRMLAGLQSCWWTS